MILRELKERHARESSDDDDLGGTSEKSNSRDTMTTDAACAPSHIQYPLARFASQTKLEKIASISFFSGNQIIAGILCAFQFFDKTLQKAVPHVIDRSSGVNLRKTQCRLPHGFAMLQGRLGGTKKRVLAQQTLL